MARFHLRLGLQRDIYPSEFTTITLPRENFVAKKQRMSSRFLTVQLAHKDIPSIHKPFCHFSTTQHTNS